MNNCVHFLRKNWFTLSIISIFVVGVVLRFWNLADTGHGFHYDEAYNGLDALKTAQNADFKIFYRGNYGRDALMVWLMGLVHMVLPPSDLALRLAPALVGTLGVLAFPFLIKNLPNKDLTEPKEALFYKLAALIGALTMVASVWHIIYSRTAYRAILDPTMMTLGALFFFITINNLQRKKAWLYSALAGFILGLGVYGYGTYKFFVFPVGFLWLYYFFTNKNRIKLIPMGITGLITAFPFLQFWYENPHTLTARAKMVSIWRKPLEARGIEPWPRFWESVYEQIVMLIGTGDPKASYHVPGDPQMFRPLAIIFYIGLILVLFAAFLPVLKMIWKKLNTKKGIMPPFLAIFMLIWYFTQLIPSSILFQEENAHALHGLGQMVPVFILTGVGGAWVSLRIWNWATKTSKIMQKVVILGFSGFTLAVIADGAYDYHHRFVNFNDMVWLDGRERRQITKNAYKTNETDTIKALIDGDSKQNRWYYIGDAKNYESDLLHSIFAYLSGVNNPQYNINLLKTEDVAGFSSQNPNAMLWIHRRNLGKVQDFIPKEQITSYGD